jgi:hypothetical protein
LKEGGRASVGVNRARMRGVFVVAQLAAAIVLLIGAMLMVRSFMAMRSVDPGFDGTNIVTMEMEVPAARYPDDARVAAFFERLTSKLNAIPGVEKSAVVSWFPIGGTNSSSNFSVEGIGEVKGALAPLTSPISPSRGLARSRVRARSMRPRHRNISLRWVSPYFRAAHSTSTTASAVLT